MKRIIGILLGIFISLISFGQTQKTLTTNNQGIKLKQLSSTRIEINIQLQDIKIQKQHINGQDYLVIENNLTKKIEGNGEPMLPVINKLIEIPAGAEVEIKKITYTNYRVNLQKEFGDIPLLPAQPPMRKDQVKNKLLIDKKTYSLDQFLNKNIAQIKTLGWLRNTRLGELTIKPFDYNPKRNILTVYDNINIILELKNADWNRTNEIKKRYTSAVYQFNNITLNHLPQPKALLTSLPLKMIIVTPDEFISYGLMQFVQLKEQQGFDVVIAPTSQIGSDTASIRSWLKNYYETNSHPQDFVLFIGDVDKLPSWPQRTQDQHVTDLYYCEYTGDYLPEVYWGRFPVDDTMQLWNIIRKTLDYEKLQVPNIDYFNTALLVAGNDESNEDTYGNGQVYYGETYYFNPSNGINGHSLYQDPPAGASYSDTIINLINQGCGFANYSAHCSPDGWADPAFSHNDITNNLQTNQLYGVWIGNCCQSNKYDEEDAFGEIAVYSKDKGAAAYIGGSDYTYWDEDYWWAVGYTNSITATPSYDNSEEGVFDGYFHTLANENNNPNKWFITTAQMIWAGNLSVEQSTSSLKHYYWEIYQVMGDPTLIPFIGTPQAITITTASPILKGNNEVNIQTTPYTYLTVYQDGSRIGTGISDGNGNALINTSITISADTLDVYAYGQNKIPTHTKLNTTNPDFPISQTNLINTTVDYVSNGSLYITVENTNDTANIDEIYINLLCDNSDALNIQEDSVFIGTLPAGTTDTITVNYISGNVPDMTQVPLIIKTTQIYNNDTVTLNKIQTITIYSGNPEVIAIEINDDNGTGTLDSNETGQIMAKIVNNGHAAISNLNAEISSTPALAHFSNNPQNIQTLQPQDTITIYYSFYCDTFSTATLGSVDINLYNDLFDKNFNKQVWFGTPKYVSLSTGNETITDYPFNNYWKYGETQILIKKDEISKLQTINEISFQLNNTTPNGYYFTNFRIGFLAANTNELSSWIDTTQFTTVYYNSNQYISDNNGWIYFHLSDWQVDTSKDLIVLISWGQNGDYVAQSQAFSVYGQTTSFNSVLYKNYDDASWGGDETDAANVRPAIKIGKGEISALNELTINQNLKIYPNPAKDFVYLTLDNASNTTVEFINTYGQVIKKLHTSNGQINIKDLEPGIYLLRIKTPSHSYSVKLIKE